MIETNSLPDLLKTKAKENPHEVALLIPDNKNDWLSISFHGFYQVVVDLGWKFMDLGIKKGDVVAIMATMGHEWELIHHAILSLGGIVVGIDPDEKSEQLEAILKVAGIEILVIDRLARLNKFCESIKAQLKSVITFDESSDECDITNSITIFSPKKPIGNLRNAPLPDVVQPDDIATIIFTSGTTGTPKGIAYRHDQIIAAIHAILQTFPELPSQIVTWLVGCHYLTFFNEWLICVPLPGVLKLTLLASRKKLSNFSLKSTLTYSLPPTFL